MLELLTTTSVDLAASAVRFGEGLFETIRIHAGAPLRLQAHLERLGQGTAFLGMPAPPGAGRLLAFLEAHTLCAGVAHGTLRLLAVDGHLHVTVQDGLPPSPLAVAAALSLHGRRFSGSPLNRFKTLSYLENRLLAREAETRGLFEVIALNEQGRLTDGGRTTLFVAYGGQLLTPPVADGALPGIARRSLLEAGLAREAPLAPGDLDRAQGLLLTNALRGAIPVDTWEGAAKDPSHPLLVLAVELLKR
jgi:branched-chain amino acid aminotransferase